MTDVAARVSELERLREQRSEKDRERRRLDEQIADLDGEIRLAEYLEQRRLEALGLGVDPLGDEDPADPRAEAERIRRRLRGENFDGSDLEP